MRSQDPLHAFALALLIAPLASSGCSSKPAPNPHKTSGTATPTDPCPGVTYPDPSASLYLLPYPVGVQHNVRQGNCNDGNSHNEKTGEQFAYDFEMPIGSIITASRGGTVIYAEGKYTDDQRGLSQANSVYIDHGDLTFAKYGHLTHEGALVKKGDVVVAGQPIGKSGNSGLSKGPHLHFAVGQCPPGKRIGGADCYTVPTTFRNTRPHPRGLMGSPTSEIGGGETYLATTP